MNDEAKKEVRAESVTIQEGGAGRIVADTVHIQEGGAGIIQGQEVRMQEGGAFALIADRAELQDSGAFLVVARQIGGQAKIIFDFRAAVLFGLIVGLSIALYKMFVKGEAL